MADGEVEVSVRADGVEDAAGEFDQAAGPGGGGDGITGGGGGGGKAGTAGKLLARIATLLVFLGPILDVLGSVSGLLTAFVAPLAVMLQRLLQPVLRGMLKLLPKWIAFTDTVSSVIGHLSVLGKIGALLGIIAGGFAGAKLGAVVGAIIGGFLGSVVPGLGTAIGATVGAKVGAIAGTIIGGITGGVSLAAIGDWISTYGGDLVNGLKNLPGRIWTFMQRLPDLIGTAVGNRIPDLPGLGGGGGGGIGSRVAGLLSGFTGGDGGGGGDGPVVNISGGLGSFVDSVTQDGSIDFP